MEMRANIQLDQHPNNHLYVITMYHQSSITSLKDRENRMIKDCKIFIFNNQ